MLILRRRNSEPHAQASGFALFPQPAGEADVSLHRTSVRHRGSGTQSPAQADARPTRFGIRALATLACFAGILCAADDPEALYQNGLRLFAAGQAQAAIDSFRKAIDLRPAHAETWKALGVVYAASADYSHAEEPFHRACLLNARLPDACLYFGRTLYLLDRFDDAINVLRAAAENDPQNAQIYRIQGLALEGAGKSKDAETAFQQAMRLEKTSALNEDPAIDYGVFLYRRGDAAAALVPLQAAVDRHPNASRAQVELGCALLELDRLDAAIAHLKAAVILDPNASRPHLLLAKAYQRTGKLDLAKQELDQGSRMVK